MEKSFAQLLRHSKIASYDRTLGQVYTSPKRYRKIGDWGLKRNLPTVIRTKFVEIGALDTAEHQTPWESGDGKVLFVKRWKENFPNSRKPAPRSDNVQHNAATMTPAEFSRLLKKAQASSAEFQQKLANKEITAEQVFDYLNVNFAETTEQESVVGPTYSDHEVAWDYPVQGRILNGDRANFAIGVGGVVANMSKRYVAGLRSNGDRSLRIFYVRSAELDEQGKPRVEVALQPKNSTSNIPLLGDNYDVIDNYNRRNKYRSEDMSVNEMMNTKQPRRKQIAELEDNSTPNPEHTELMARISVLLDSTKDA